LTQIFQVFGSAPGSQKANGTTIPIQSVVQRSGGFVGGKRRDLKILNNGHISRFMEDAIEMEQANIHQTNHNHNHNNDNNNVNNMMPPTMITTGGSGIGIGRQSAQRLIGNLSQMKKRKKRRRKRK
jgi:hypothetical protein